MAEAVDWALAGRIARRVAGTEPLAESYLYHSLEPDFAEATVKAEELVAVETGLRSLDGPARGRVIDRGQWIDANIRSFQRLLKPLTDSLAERLSDGRMSTVSGRVGAVQLGSILGWMSRRVLGQYDLLLTEDEDPADQDLVYYVGPNVLALEKRFAFPPGEFRLWLAVHELTHRAQFTGVTWMRHHFIDLVQQTLEAVDPDPDRILKAVKTLISERRAGHSTTLDGGVALLFASEEQRLILDEISGLMSLLEGHGDITMGRAGGDLIPSSDRFHRVLHNRRSSAKGVARMMQKLMGLDAKMAQYEQGEKFIEAIEAERGNDAVLAVWQDVSNLPSIAEIRAPELWMDRVPALLSAD